MHPIRVPVQHLSAVSKIAEHLISEGVNDLFVEVSDGQMELKAPGASYGVRSWD